MQKPPHNQLYRAYKADAKRRGREFSLTQEEFYKMAFSNCHYCGAFPATLSIDYTSTKRTSYAYNGIDRVDSSKGYIMGNVVACCKYCNAFKSNHSEEKFLNHVKKIQEFQESK